MLRRQSQHNNHHGGGSNHHQGGGNHHNHFLQEARLAAAALRASNASKSPPTVPAAARPAASPPVARLLKRIRPTPVCPGAPVRPKKKNNHTVDGIRYPDAESALKATQEQLRDLRDRKARNDFAIKGPQSWDSFFREQAQLKAAAAIADESPSHSSITAGLALQHNTVVVDGTTPVCVHPPVVPQHSTVDLNLFFKSTPSLCADDALTRHLTVAEDATIIKAVLEGHGELSYSGTCRKHIDTFNLPSNFWSHNMARGLAFKLFKVKGTPALQATIKQRDDFDFWVKTIVLSRATTLRQIKAFSHFLHLPTGYFGSNEALTIIVSMSVKDRSKQMTLAVRKVQREAIMEDNACVKAFAPADLTSMVSLRLLTAEDLAEMGVKGFQADGAPSGRCTRDATVGQAVMGRAQYDGVVLDHATMKVATDSDSSNSSSDSDSSDSSSSSSSNS